MAISIETTQNVAIEYDPASVGERVIAGIVDVFVILGYMFVVLVIAEALDAMSSSIRSVIEILLALPLFLYPLLCEVFLDGQTIGFKAMKIKVVKVDGSQPTLGSYLLRWLLLPIDSFFFIGLLLIAASGKGQRLGDIAAGTTAIKLRPRVSLHEALLPDVQEDYEPMYPTVTRLSDNDIAIIRDVWAAGRAQQMRATLDALATRVATVIGVEETLRSPGYGGHEQFLETVIRDYTYYTQGLHSGVGSRRA